MIWLVVLLQAVPAVPAVPPSEREALIALYDATGGERWIDHSEWKGPVGSECDWFGVDCMDGIEGDAVPHVVEIELPKNHLVGSIPGDLANLQYLMKLDVSENDLSLPLPDSLLEKWDTGYLDLEVGGAGVPFDEVRLSLISNVYCADQVIILRSSGTVLYYRDRCRAPFRENPQPYCELRRGETSEFPRVARFLVTHGFFGRHDPPPFKGAAVDVGIVTVTTRGPTAIHSVEVFPNGDDSLDSWSYEKILRGVAEEVHWSAPIESAKCPWP